jgi:ABC-2 type transport system permease protein
MLLGFGFVLDLFTGWAPQYVIDLVASFSMLTHVNAIARGVLEVSALFYFGALIALFLFLNQQMVEVRKAS